MCISTQYFQILAIRLDLFRKVLLAHHGTEVGEVVDLLYDVVELLSRGGLRGYLFEVKDVLWLLLLVHELFYILILKL